MQINLINFREGGGIISFLFCMRNCSHSRASSRVYTHARFMQRNKRPNKDEKNKFYT